MIFVDTTLLIDFLRSKTAAKSFIEKYQSTPLYISEINAFELIEGVYCSASHIPEHLEKVIGLLTLLTILPFDRKAALKAGMISGRLTCEGKKIGEIDCLIAGVAIANGITHIVTANKEHFQKIKELKVFTY